jgi:hypothetical protein
MLHRFTFWLRRTWQKLPVQLSLLGWPPLLSHSLAFIVGTLVLQQGEAGLRVPDGRVLVPVDKLRRLDADGKPWKETQKIAVLQRRAEAWCRSADDELKLWKAPGRRGGLYLLWPSGANAAARLQQLLQKKSVLTAEGKDFAFCGAEAEGPVVSRGIQYD